MNKNNKFKLFNNKTSLAKRQSRMLNGGDTEIKGDKLGWWERENFEKNITTDIPFIIPEIYDRRPDLLSYRVYQTPRLFWLILQYNNIVDVEEEFRTGQQIILPSRVRALTSMVNNNIISEQIEE
jgi:hypothetical protein